MGFEAEATGYWTITIQTPAGMNITVDLTKYRDIYTVNNPQCAGGHAVAAFWSEEAAVECIKVLLEDSVNKKYMEDKPYYNFTISKIPLEPLDQLVRLLAQDEGNNKYAGSYMDRRLGEYDLVASPSGMLYRMPRLAQKPYGWIVVDCSELRYGGRLISLLWSLPILRDKEEVSGS